MQTSVSIMILPNGSPPHSYSSFSCEHRFHFHRLHCCLRVNSALNAGKKYAIFNAFGMVSIFLPKMSPMSLITGFKKVENPLIVPNMVATVEYGLFCEEGEEDELGQIEKVRFQSHIVEQALPPWGNLALCNGSDSEPVVVNQPQSGPKDKVISDVNTIHYLEERDEEMLSKRILVLSRRNKFRSAMELLKSMELLGLYPNLHACNSLLSCLLRNGLLDDGLRVFEFMKAKQMTTGHTYSLILKAVANAKGCGTALQMFIAMEGDCKVKNNFDTIVYNTMISISGRVNNWHETLRLWRCMKANGHGGTQITYCLLVSNFVRCSQNDLALDAYNEMVEKKIEPRIDTMQAIIGACTKEGEWSFALSVFQSMLNSGLKPNAIACNALINCLGKAGEDKLAFKIYDIMKSLGHSPDTYTWNALLTALYRANRHDDALQLFASIKNDQDSKLNLHLYNIALMACSKLGLWDRALQLLWQMEASEMSISAASYNHVISACEMARKPDVALQVYEHMVHQKCTPDTFIYLSLLRVCIWGSLWDEVEEILNAAPDVSLYNAAIQGLCLRGKIESAKKLYMKMRKSNLQPDGKTRALMLQNLRKDSIKRRYKRPFWHRKRKK
ncbi:pentatricopeptide repeat-containing protein At3g29290 isoform X2 [Ziziphus jujuba]|uniref:Pentatricopeptide repeat-containing protein At3g29290 isoform X2 n=1 Tax=Ziziphus jujuba TaxID=326968 RepID=A0A6P3ZKB7_ZIZJJ|nr:pentatricopeptide repeat-containing protein At3g29290 isoform X2 [Ziziphus jujuba]